MSEDALSELRERHPDLTFTLVVEGPALRVFAHDDGRIVCSVEFDKALIDMVAIFAPLPGFVAWEVERVMAAAE